jgi:hypothetical protein
MKLGRTGNEKYNFWEVTPPTGTAYGVFMIFSKNIWEHQEARRTSCQTNNLGKPEI